jgi:hypothetical protein
MDVPWTDRTPFLHARPVARLGNLLIDRGTFELPWVRSLHAYMGAVMLQHSPKPDPQKIETLLTEAVRLNPRAYPMRISLGNALVKRGRRDEAVRAFTAARDTLLAGDPLHEILDRHIELVRREPLQGVPQLTNPWAE